MRRGPERTGQGRLAAVGLLAGLGLCVAACAPGTGQGRADTAPRLPRVVSQNPCTDALVLELADPAQVLAVSAYSHDRMQSSTDVAVARRFRAVSGSVEEAYGLHPDLVLDGNYAAPATAAAYARLGLRREAFAMPATIAESVAQVRRMGALLGHPDRAEALVERINAAVRAAASSARRPRALIWQGGGHVAGPQTLIADLVAHTGMVSFGAQRGYLQSQILPLERVLADPPDLVLAIAHAPAQDRVLNHPALSAMRSPVSGRAMPVYTVPPRLEYCGGPTIPLALDQLVRIRATYVQDHMR
ncbi:ABC transporter substrate-binding protein [Novosphingobium sp. FSY-8]|uniref:ABC transporter substrate-binding protein n=1 Tax=Novosphingobium ovatum TaxID=1908523 RepID=A0ABW9X9W8_9SPHN|nr:ABC transporter substrate-binding protein [Novosphingobium ovatum]NBC35297.1 ABC transporter substrate-binding protein [Novosphingobium ovatum]